MAWLWKKLWLHLDVLRAWRLFGSKQSPEEVHHWSVSMS
ncbi:hypothetical protein RISK_004940 [Rhodopirellula islandica]|uniref:Uncharacterized protein n=1 Tax=Rhodopirellula islandica TaxID=595434 RepID=A0A0J1B825_RHOIS|nr:hypothetical protein RISK_004940 [Rhodopirellula islandica]